MISVEDYKELYGRMNRDIFLMSLFMNFASPSSWRPLVICLSTFYRHSSLQASRSVSVKRL